MSTDRKFDLEVTLSIRCREEGGPIPDEVMRLKLQHLIRAVGEWPGATESDYRGCASIWDNQDGRMGLELRRAQVRSVSRTAERERIG